MNSDIAVYGNYHRYYGYRNAGKDRLSDPRVDLFKEEWFKDKDVLDIGCNSGHVTCVIGKLFKPKLVVGIDIDGKLINKAYKDVKHYLDVDNEDFPASVCEEFGDLPPKVPSDKDLFPHNVYFVASNFIVDSMLDDIVPEYDVILALSITKWIHLNWGDNGIKKLFKRSFKLLRDNGCLIIEIQPLNTYSKKTKSNQLFKDNIKNMTLKPDMFEEYLLSEEIGFTKIEHLGVSANESKGFQRPLVRCIKGAQPSHEGN